MLRQVTDKMKTSLSLGETHIFIILSSYFSTDLCARDATGCFAPFGYNDSLPVHYDGKIVINFSRSKVQVFEHFLTD